MTTARVMISLFIATFWALAALGIFSLTTLPPLVCAGVVWVFVFVFAWCAIGLCQAAAVTDEAIREAGDEL